MQRNSLEDQVAELEKKAKLFEKQAADQHGKMQKEIAKYKQQRGIVRADEGGELSNPIIEQHRSAVQILEDKVKEIREQIESLKQQQQLRENAQKVMDQKRTRQSESGSHYQAIPSSNPNSNNVKETESVAQKWQQPKRSQAVPSHYGSIPDPNNQRGKQPQSSGQKPKLGAARTHQTSVENPSRPESGNYSKMPNMTKPTTEPVTTRKESMTSKSDHYEQMPPVKRTSGEQKPTTSYGPIPSSLKNGNTAPSVKRTSGEQTSSPYTTIPSNLTNANKSYESVTPVRKPEGQIYESVSPVRKPNPQKPEPVKESTPYNKMPNQTGKLFDHPNQSKGSQEGIGEKKNESSNYGPIPTNRRGSKEQ